MFSSLLDKVASATEGTFAEELGLTSAVRDFKESHEQFMAEAARATAPDEGPAQALSELPWADLGEDQAERRGELRERVLALSRTRETFLEAPEGAGEAAAAFKVEKYVGAITKLLEEDPGLAKMQAKLSYRCGEAEFWGNYFQHVARVRREMGLPGLTVPSSAAAAAAAPVPELAPADTVVVEAPVSEFASEDPMVAHPPAPPAPPAPSGAADEAAPARVPGALADAELERQLAAELGSVDDFVEVSGEDAAALEAAISAELAGADVSLEDEAALEAAIAAELGS